MTLFRQLKRALTCENLLQAAARANIFYYDLGGTYCACEKQWNVQEYWGKTFSGLAFNLPHFIDLAKILIKYSLR